MGGWQQNLRSDTLKQSYKEEKIQKQEVYFATPFCLYVSYWTIVHVNMKFHVNYVKYLLFLLEQVALVWQTIIHVCTCNIQVWGEENINYFIDHFQNPILSFEFGQNI